MALRPKRGVSLVPHDLGIEPIAGRRNTSGGKDVDLPIIEKALRRIEPHDGEIGGAAAKVADEDGLRLGQRGLVGAGGGDRLVLEMDGFKSSQSRGGSETILGQVIAFRVFVKDGGPSEDEVLAVDPGGTVCPKFEIPQVMGDEFLDRVGFVVDDRLGEGLVGKDRLDRLEQAAVHMVADVAVNRFLSEEPLAGVRAERPGMWEVHEGRFLMAEEGMIHDGSLFAIPDGDRRIAGAEIDAVDKGVNERGVHGERGDRTENRGKWEDQSRGDAAHLVGWSNQSLAVRSRRSVPGDPPSQKLRRDTPGRVTPEDSALMKLAALQNESEQNPDCVRRPRCVNHSSS